MSFTPEQHRIAKLSFARQREAADPKISAWVSANAGSGKTRVLVDRVLRLLLAGAPLDRILCLTFTTAAATQMLDRLFARLSSWSFASDDELREALNELTGAPYRGALDGARALFATALDAPGGANIQTIHAYCEKLLRRFPLESGVSPDFRVADELEAAAMQREALAIIAAAAETKAAIAEPFRRAARDKTPDDLRSLLSAYRRKQLFAERPDGGDEEELWRELKIGSEETPDTIRSAYLEALDRNLFRHAEALAACAGQTDRDLAQALEWAARERDPLRRFERLKSALLTKSLTPKTRLLTKAAADANPQALEELRGEQQRLAQAVARMRAAKFAADNIAFQRLAGAFHDAYENVKLRRGRLDFDDLIIRAKELLEDRELSPWILFKLDGGVDHILIDEAQDTNPEQWTVIETPAREFFAGEGARDSTRTLFVVGDEKQSIYAFQGSDVGVYSAKLIELGKLAAASAPDTDGPENFRHIHLIHSFRSAPAILNFVDAAFDSPALVKAVTSDEKAVRHEAVRAGAGGLVELWDAEEPPEKRESTPWEAPLDLEPENSAPAILSARIAGKIRRWLDKETELEALGRPIRPGDILILVRKRGGLFENLIKALKRAGIPTAGADRIALRDELAVQDLVSLAKFALLPEDDLSLAELLRSPLINLSEDALYRVAHGREGRLWPALTSSEDPEARKASALLQPVVPRADLSPYEFFATALNEGAPSGRRRFYERLGAAAADGIDEFLRLARNYEQLAGAALQQFLDWFADQSIDIKRQASTGGDEVRVMTVHGAKGLESPIVFLPDTCGRPKRKRKVFESRSGRPLVIANSKEAPEFARDILQAADDADGDEYYRQFYVAMTRACDQLYICGYKQRTRDGGSRIDKGCWYEIARGAMDECGERFDDAEGGGFRFSIKPRHRPARPAPPPAPPPEPPSWPRKLGARRQVGGGAPTRTSAGGDASAASPLAEPDQAIVYGTIVHKLLERLAPLAPSQREAAAQTIMAGQPDVDPDTERKLLAEAFRALELDIFNSPGKLLVEAAIAGEDAPDGAVSLRRADLIKIGGSRIDLVDYKTGEAPPAGAPPPEAYIRQMAVYRARLARVFSDHNIVCSLLWTSVPRLDALADALLKTAR